MKKVLLFIFSIVLLSGCGKTTKLNLEKIKNKLETLESNGQVIFSDNAYYDLTKLENKYDIDTSEIDEYIVSMHKNEANSNLYIIASYKNSKEKLKNELDKLIDLEKASFGNGYFPLELRKVEDYYYKEYGKYLIYIVSDDNELVYQKIIEEKE